MLCKFGKNLNLDATDKLGKNAIQYAILAGNVAIFSKVVLTLFIRKKINNFQTLSNSNIDIRQWINSCPANKLEMQEFLEKLKKRWNTDRFGSILSLLKSNSETNY